MQIKSHQKAQLKSAELISDEILIQSIEDGTNLMGDLYYQGYDRIIIYEQNLTSDFFDLKTKMAGEILQKFSNYRMRLAIIGDLSKYTSKSFNDFKFECNQTKQIHFASSLNEVLEA
ncbi:DUF4180 domain-containing protein [bacterium SCSIO 12643]|nr:DUF4180 domain-containing protein [bacterium SCSIO 12643]